MPTTPRPTKADMASAPARAAALTFAIALPIAAAPAGVVTPLNTTRSVSVLNRETNPQTSQSFTGPTLGPWQQQAYEINDSSNPNWNPFGSVLAVTSSQQSNFTPEAITFSGFVFIDFLAPVQPIQGGSASNRCDAMFHVEGACDYSLSAQYSGTDFHNETTGTVFLRNDGTLQSLFSINSSGTRTGTLSTGNYTLSILIEGSASGNMAADGRKQIDLTFGIPAPGGIALVVPLAIWHRRRRPSCR